MILTVTLNPAIDKVYQVEDFFVGEVFRPKAMWATAGGKGLNVSRVCTILGEKVLATGFIGGNAGMFIRQGVEKDNILDGFMDVQGETRTCIAINDPVRRTSTEVLEGGPEISLEDQQKFIEHFKEISAKGDIITISGSLPKGVPADYYGKLIEIAKSNNKTVILDTSGQPLKESLKYRPHMIKPNISELKWLTGKELDNTDDIIDAATEMHDMGIAVVCVSLGKDGCIMVCDDGVYKYTTPDIPVVNTVGSGDSFVAGWATAYVRGYDAKKATINAMACGTANTQFHETGRVSVELVDKFFDMITVSKIK